MEVWQTSNLRPNLSRRRLRRLRLGEERKKIEEEKEEEEEEEQEELECGPMPNVMDALPNIGGALCSTP